MKKLLLILCTLSMITTKTEDFVKGEKVAKQGNKIFFKDQTQCNQFCQNCALQNNGEAKDWYECQGNLKKSVEDTVSEIGETKTKSPSPAANKSCISACYGTFSNPLSCLACNIFG
jgi:hypothetical protein